MHDIGDVQSEHEGIKVEHNEQLPLASKMYPKSHRVQAQAPKTYP